MNPADVFLVDLSRTRLPAATALAAVAVALLAGGVAVLRSASVVGPGDVALVASARPAVTTSPAARSQSAVNAPAPEPAPADPRPPDAPPKARATRPEAAPSAAPAATPTPTATAVATSDLTPASAAPAVPAPTPTSTPAPVRVPLVEVEPRLAAFAGLGTWVDLYDTGLAPAAQVDAAAAGGAQAIWVQTARYNSADAVADPVRLGTLIEAAHDRGLRVVTWYIPDFTDPARDLHRAQWSMGFRSPRGDTADGFGLDIESELLPDTLLRTQRLLELSDTLRAWAPDFPMAAIVLPPLMLDLRPPWWPGFPYDRMAQTFDVLVPMSYSATGNRDPRPSHAWNLANVLEVRRRAGDADVAVHLAGGIADRLEDVPGFLAAASEGGVIGGSLYDLHTTRPETWPLLQALRNEALPPR